MGLADDCEAEARIGLWNPHHKEPDAADLEFLASDIRVKAKHLQLRFGRAFEDDSDLNEVKRDAYHEIYELQRAVNALLAEVEP